MVRSKCLISNPQQTNRRCGVSALGKTKLVFINRGVKINAAYYQSEILKKHARPSARRLFGRRNWWLQQDWAPAHGARSTMECCSRLFRNKFWDKTMYPNCSPDLNPVDYAIWGLLMQRLGRKKYRSLQELKAALRRAWKSIRVEELRNIVGQFKKRLEACVIAKGGNFEHLLH